MYLLCAKHYARGGNTKVHIGAPALKELVVQGTYQQINEQMYRKDPRKGRWSPLGPYRQGFFPRYGDSGKAQGWCRVCICWKKQDAKVERPKCGEQLWVHDWLWLEWRMLAAVMGRLEASVGQLQA